MRIMRILLAGVVVLTGASQATAAFLLTGLSKPSQGTPYYADFSVGSLTVANTATGSSGSKTATLTISGASGAGGESYYSSSQSAGTGGQYNKSFTGSFSLTANIVQAGSRWNLTSGNFTIKGDLLGGSSTDILLTGSLLTGLNSPTGNWIFGNNGAQDEFDFLYAVNTTQDVQGNGNNKILQDWATVNPVGTTVVGAMSFTFNPSTVRLTGSPFSAWNGTDLGQSFSGGAGGTGDVWVPEPADYGWTGVGCAALAMAMMRRERAKRISAAN